MRTSTTLARSIAVALIALGAGACSDSAAPVAPVVPSSPSMAKGGPNALPTNGRIYFTSNFAGSSSEVYSMNPDGTDRRRLTFTSEWEQYLDVSRDGKKLIVATEAEGALEGYLYAMNADGTNRRLVMTVPGSRIISPDLSPDGRSIAYGAAAKDAPVSAIWTVSASGGKATQLTPSTVQATWPSWSPDGARIVYAATAPGSDKLSLYIMNADGSGATVLRACDPGCGTPVWTPDGARIVYTEFDGPVAHVRWCAMQQPAPLCALSTGIDMTSLTLDVSPDGSQLAYMQTESSTDRIATANLNGSGQTFVTANLRTIYDLAWGR